MLRPKSGMASNTKVTSKTVNNLESIATSNYQLVKKQNEKNKKQIELKSKIDIPIDDSTRILKKEKIKQILIKEETKSLIQPVKEESKKSIPANSKSKEKTHKKTLSEIPKTISNLDTSEQEDDDDVMFSVSYNNRIHNKNTKFMNLKKKNEAMTYENDSLYEDNIPKKKRPIDEYAKTDINNTTSQGYNVLNYSKHVSPVIKSHRPPSDNLSTDKGIDPLMTEEGNSKDQRYQQLLEKYNYITAEYITLKTNENDYRKTIDLLTNLVRVQNSRINELVEEKGRILREKANEHNLMEKEKERYIGQNLNLKSLVSKIYTKLSLYEKEENEREEKLQTTCALLIKENEFLRKGMETALGNLIVKETAVEENKPSEKSSIPKKKRNPTQINFDFLEKDSIERKQKAEDSQEETSSVNKLVQDFKMTKARKTIKPGIDIITATVNTERSVKSSNSSSSNLLSVSSTQSGQENGNYMSKKLDSHQTNMKPKQHYLFPKTPNNDEKKNFEFKKENNDENVSK